MDGNRALHCGGALLEFPGIGVTHLRIISIPLALQSCSKAPLGKELGLIKGSSPGIPESIYADAGDTTAKTRLVLAVSVLSIINPVSEF